MIKNMHKRKANTNKVIETKCSSTQTSTRKAGSSGVAVRARKDLDKQLKKIQDKYDSSSATSPSPYKGPSRESNGALEARMYAYQQEIEQRYESRLRREIQMARIEENKLHQEREEAMQQAMKNKYNEIHEEANRRVEQCKRDMEDTMKDREVGFLKERQEIESEKSTIEIERRKCKLEDLRVDHILKAAEAKLEVNYVIVHPLDLLVSYSNIISRKYSPFFTARTL